MTRILLLSLLLVGGPGVAAQMTGPAQTSSPPAAPASQAPAQNLAPAPVAAYTFDILDANRQPVGTFDAAGQLRVSGALSIGTLLRISRPGASRLFQLAQPVTAATRLGEVQLVYGSGTVTLAALLSGSAPTAENARPTISPQQLNSILGLSTSLGSVSVGMGTSASLMGLPVALPLILPLF
ncbi:hypothetical protein [Deinococcus hohokamensis]|uniref:Uncharacterized protein n=1 Tax=Deinococcus hohokamensis TaxID=309883 RepID=A0ABV9I9U7_9DEIO